MYSLILIANRKHLFCIKFQVQYFQNRSLYGIYEVSLYHTSTNSFLSNNITNFYNNQYLSAEADYATMANIISTDGISMVDMYDSARAAEKNFEVYWNNIDNVNCDGIDEYKRAAKFYILNMLGIASSIEKYVDKQNIQDLSDAKACMTDSQNYALLVANERLKYLTASGYSDDEAMKIISPESESSSK